MAAPRILLTNDDGYDAPGLAALKSLASQLGEVYVIAPREQHSYAGHRVTTDRHMVLEETGEREFSLTGTPADCVRVALTSYLPDVDWVLAGINLGGNLGSDLFTSGTVAAAREAAYLGKPAIAISQYIRRDLPLDWKAAGEMALPVIRDLLQRPIAPRHYWNVNLPHLEPGATPKAVIECVPDHQPMDVRFHRTGSEFRFSGAYAARPRTPGRDVDHCFAGAITVSHLEL
jgi:5'-nucleotidase